MKSRKIINDPVHGFISVPFEIIMELIEHPIFQRLRRIKQLGMTDFVYPGAVHTRFHHALGAMHLMIDALRTLREKGVPISDHECEAACIAILLHDIGHGPYSHALEHLISPVPHEELSLRLMKKLDKEFSGRLALAIEIFQGSYNKSFLHELVSSQLDMDRMDYLTRDSFFTGVAEGVVGYDRIIKMLDVRDNRLVVEEKAIYSIEKFLLARHFMYWQVYLHKTVLSTEIMLQEFYKKSVSALDNTSNHFFSHNLIRFIHNENSNGPALLDNFILLDDSDVLYTIKSHLNHPNPSLKRLANGLINRELFKLVLSSKDEVSDLSEKLRLKAENEPLKDDIISKDLIFTGEESTTFYSEASDEILVLKKNGEVRPLSNFLQVQNLKEITKRYYISFPK